MFLVRRVIAFCIVGLCVGNCATIMSDSEYMYEIQSEPSGVQVSIYADGRLEHSITTPGQALLNLKHDYTMKFELAGYNTHFLTVSKTVDLWVVGNVCLGGAIGLCVDFYTGAIWKPRNSVIYWRMQKRLQTSREALPVYDVVLTLKTARGVVYEGSIELAPGDEIREQPLREVLIPGRPHN